MLKISKYLQHLVSAVYTQKQLFSHWLLVDDSGEGVLTPYPVGPEGKSPFFPVSQVSGVNVHSTDVTNSLFRRYTKVIPMQLLTVYSPLMLQG